MKKTITRYLLIFGILALLPGCISIPPLIQVQHKDSGIANEDIKRRLDSIDRRLDKMEKDVKSKPSE